MRLPWPAGLNLLVAACALAEASALLSRDYDAVPSIAGREERPDDAVGAGPEIIRRCRAQELAPGSALGIIVVLATASAVHMPGSLRVPRRSCFYRLAPELGIAEVLYVLLAVGQATLLLGQPLRRSVTAVLALRHFRAEGDLWWRRPDCDPAAESPEGRARAARRCHECAAPFLRRVQAFGSDRLLGDGLALLALVKALAVGGTARTGLLAASYALSFCALELLSLAALRVGPPRGRAEREGEALECARLITLLDDSKEGWRYRIEPLWLARAPGDAGAGARRTSYAALNVTVWAVFGLPAALHLIFWPFSVPLFVGWDSKVKHSRGGRWVFQWLTAAEWLCWVAGFLGGLYLLGLAAAATMDLASMVLPSRGADGIRLKYVRAYRSWPVERWLMGDETERLYDVYAVLKVAIIVRFYVWTYTGQGTTKAGWLDWLG